MLYPKPLSASKVKIWKIFSFQDNESDANVEDKARDRFVLSCQNIVKFNLK